MERYSTQVILNRVRMLLIMLKELGYLFMKPLLMIHSLMKHSGKNILPLVRRLRLVRRQVLGEQS